MDKKHINDEIPPEIELSATHRAMQKALRMELQSSTLAHVMSYEGTGLEVDQAAACTIHVILQVAAAHAIMAANTDGRAPNIEWFAHNAKACFESVLDTINEMEAAKALAEKPDVVQ